MTAEEFRNRPLTVRTLTLCPECDQLREDVEQRVVNWYPHIKATCCAPCWLKSVGVKQPVAC